MTAWELGAVVAAAATLGVSTAGGQDDRPAPAADAGGVTARVVAPGPEVVEYWANSDWPRRIGRTGELELVNPTAAPVRVTVTPSRVRVTIRYSDGSTLPGLDFGLAKDADPAPARAVEVPAGGYVGLSTIHGSTTRVSGRPRGGADVHIGPLFWRLPPGRYRVEGEVDMTVGDRPVTVRLTPTSFTIP